MGLRQGDEREQIPGKNANPRECQIRQAKFSQGRKQQQQEEWLEHQRERKDVGGNQSRTQRKQTVPRRIKLWRKKEATGREGLGGQYLEQQALQRIGDPGLGRRAKSGGTVLHHGAVTRQGKVTGEWSGRPRNRKGKRTMGEMP